jgi:hypothetical protein
MLKNERYPLFLQGFEMLTKSRLVQLIVMLTILLVLFFWKTFEKDTDKQTVEALAGEALTSQARCDYLDACEYVTKSGTFFLNVEDVPIKAEEWINFELTMPNQNITVTKSQIVGKSMFMGRIPVTFKQAQEDVYRAKTLVGACTTPEMIWLLEITVEVEGVQEVINFDFMVKR